MVDVLSKEDEERLKEIMAIRKERREKISYLRRVGERAYPTYEAILSDSSSNKHAVAVVLDIIDGESAKRSRFRNRFRRLAVTRLADKDYEVRRSAVSLFGRIGGREEAPLAAVCLCDNPFEHEGIIRAAATTLTAIGGPNELAAMDEWLRSDSYRDNADLRKHIQKCRDELKNRLSETKDPTK
jgi:hypothetical protein